VTKIKVTCIGGGGGGGRSLGRYSAGKGAAGYVNTNWFGVTETSYIVTVGAGGAVAQESYELTTGGTGGQTIFGALLRADGGPGGSSAYYDYDSGATYGGRDGESYSLKIGIYSWCSVGGDPGAAGTSGACIIEW
jgi:hypothetical protein